VGDKYVKNVADSYEQSGRVDNPGVQEAFDLWQQKQPMQLGDPNFQNDIREIKDRGQDKQIAAIQEENARLQAEQTNMQAEAARRAGNAEFAGILGKTATAGVAAAGLALGNPWIIGGSVPAGEAVQDISKRYMDHPPIPERDMTGMNGQDFEGITTVDIDRGLG